MSKKAVRKDAPVVEETAKVQEVKPTAKKAAAAKTDAKAASTPKPKATETVKSAEKAKPAGKPKAPTKAKPNAAAKSSGKSAGAVKASPAPKPKDNASKPIETRREQSKSEVEDDAVPFPLTKPLPDNTDEWTLLGLADKSGKERAQKLRAIAALYGGMSPTQVAAAQDIDIGKVYLWLGRFRAKGVAAL
jgi:hypothetical protein